MKKFLYSLAVLALAASCGQGGFTIKGTIENAEGLPKGAMVYLYDGQTAIDSVAITDGTFSFKGKANPEKMYTLGVGYPGRSARDPRWRTAFLPEKGTFSVTLAERESTLSGGKLNDAFKAFQQKIQDIYAEYRDKAVKIADEDEEKAEALYDETVDKISDVSKETIKKNAHNYLALAALQNIIYDLDLEDLDAILAKCGKFVGDDENIHRIHECKVAELATAEGKPFVDFAGKTPEGEDVRLSDFVGQGKWVLTDFWASWCGPCMREIPNIKKTHETLSGDKFTVLGVAVWETDGDNTKSAERMKEKEMTWPQIFVGDDHTPTDSYGIVGIPTLILFAPDGTIYKRGEELRGEKMLETISGIINQ